MVNAARSRAKAAGVPATIIAADIVIPSHCPVLGIPLFRRLGRKGGCDNSPSLDRIVPEFGYVPGNIVVVSRRANRIKNDATLEELERVADFYRIGLKAYVRPGRRTRTAANP
ncbi:hypothetical protein [Caulobacter vibrioides]|uniref:Uncharacterized protein n=1 Tax=Caulobacter phage S2B TaxID=2759120 RepID=A0AAE7MLF2_9CAUD|nr:hypothetical protein [Caulobacter vibrioides]QOC54153.1 hypothetical protein [Caulobacter phage S2B]QXZ53896.1 hypothetical protein KZH45_09585 [Caulobacter vibrioides]